MADRLADYDYRALGKALRPRLEADGRGWRKLAAEIGVTLPDLSRISSGQPVSAGKVFAVCDWLGVPERRFYTPPCFTGTTLKQPACERAAVADGAL